MSVSWIMYNITCVRSEIFINGTCWAYHSALCFFHAISCFILAVLCGLRDLSSSTRDWTWAPAVKAPSPNHWTAREFPVSCFWDPSVLLYSPYLKYLFLWYVKSRLEIESWGVKIESGVAGGERPKVPFLPTGKDCNQKLEVDIVINTVGQFFLLFFVSIFLYL